jgi:hypothetical protein
MRLLCGLLTHVRRTPSDMQVQIWTAEECLRAQFAEGSNILRGFVQTSVALAVNPREKKLLAVKLVLTP